MKFHTNLDQLVASPQGILVYTDLWNLEAIPLSTLDFQVHTSMPSLSGSSSKTSTLLSIDLTSCSARDLSSFFKRCAQLTVQYPSCEGRHTQFGGTLQDGRHIPLKWFWIRPHYNNPLTIGHDTAFDTTLITRSHGQTSFTIPLGTFFRARWSRCKSTREKQFKQAYKTLANLILKS